MQIPMILNSPEFILAFNMLKKLNNRPTDEEINLLDEYYTKATEKDYSYDVEVLYIKLVNKLIYKYGFDKSKT